ncbi:DUF3080 family protein [Alishewanella sp. HL-SH06]|uniref:DUF3080 family protein n=1 Tax=Alishewanella sp. HL-SH06 TaxID=3461144 RepID=UPI0040420AC0
MNITQGLLLSVATTLLLGCSKPAGKAELADYQQRLTRVLALDKADISLLPTTPLPAKNSLLVPQPDLRMDLLDAFATRQCGLDQLIAERNSSMGRVFSVSKRLNYEIRLLAVLADCDQQDWPEPLKQQITEVYQQKLAQINSVFLNMLQTDDTLRKRWHNSDSMLAPNDSSGFNESLAALQLLVELKHAINAKDWQRASQMDPERALESLYRYDFLSKLQYSLRYTRSWFVAINPKLQQISPSTLCTNNRNTEQLAILTTVFRKFFIGEIQAYLAQLSRFQQQSWPLLDELYQDTALHPVLTQRYLEQAEQLQRLLLAHVGWYQELNKVCPVSLTSS